MRHTGAVVGIILAVCLLVGVVYYHGRSSGITFPAGGETLIAGKTYTIKWNNQGKTGAPLGTTTYLFLVDKNLLSQGASASIIDSKYAIPDSGSYSYTIPTGVEDGTYFFVIGTTTSSEFTISTSPS